MALYESEHTRFMREWLAQHPHELVEQQKGRALWWDRPQTLQRMEEVHDARVPQKPYYYLTD
ncbi:MAG TPA: DUF3460 family protein [Rhodocyclaceae bacterium]|nr:DUF3460 family protein [Rhodocyclaceae bacterium]